MAEQSRWVTPDVSILKARAHASVGIERVERSLSPSSVILEYVVADPQSYCLVISHGSSHIVPLAGREHINALVATYLKAVKTKQPGSRGGPPALRRSASTDSRGCGKGNSCGHS